ncbi:MAG: peptidylprolyl isomerase [Planctomycetaceae bacterium]|nr:peptidylprolyl isomerase [Planctomycetaceae bacterium]
MQDASPDPVKSVPPAAGKSHTAIYVGGTLALLVCGALAMQIMRGQPGKAAEANSGDARLSASAKLLSEPISRVNGTPITWQELAEECVRQHGATILEDLISRAIISQALAEKNLTVTDAEVNAEILDISKKIGLSQDDLLKMVQSDSGRSPLQYRNDVIWPMLALRKLAGTEVDVTNEMLREAYVDNYGERVKARMIVLDRLSRAQFVEEKLKANPEDFELLAREYSVEPNSKSLGGTIPPIRRFSGAHEEIRRAAFSMQTPGQLSGIIQITPTQYVILKYEGRTEPVEHDPNDVKGELYAELKDQEVQRLVGETFEQLQMAARIDNYLTNETKMPNTEKSVPTVRSADASPALESSHVGIELSE